MHASRPLLSGASRHAGATIRGSSSFAVQLRVLLWKQWLVSVRNRRATLAIIFSPVAVCIILSLFQLMSNAVLDRPVPHPPAQKIADTLPQAVCDHKSSNCTTLMYAPRGVLWVDELMRTLAKQNGLEFGADVVGLPGGVVSPSSLWCLDDFRHPIPSDQYIPGINLPKPSYLESVLANGSFPNPCDFFYDNSTMQEYILENPNTTQNAILFTSAYMKLPSGVPQGYNVTLGYSLFYNITVSKFPLRGNDHALELMRAVDSAVLQQRGGRNSATVEAELAKFPEPPSRLANYDVVSNSGAVWFPLPGLILFFSLAVDLVTEKELKLRVGLMFQGMKLSAYWGSWVITGFVLSALSTMVLLLTTRLARYSLFENTDISIMVTVFLSFSLSMVGFAFFISSLLNTRKQAQTAGYGIILVGFVFQTIIATGNGALIDLLYASDVAWWVVLIRFMLQVYPPYNWANCFFVISSVAGKHYHYSKGQVSSGDHFGWSNATQASNKTLMGNPVVIPPAVDSVYLLLANTFTYFALAWYFDSIIPSVSNGNPKHPTFCINPAYWCGGRKQNANDVASSSSSSSSSNSKDTASDKVTVRNLVKAYTSRSCCCFSHKKVLAVSNLSIEFKLDQITALLGHNGAGKSTLIGVLTGLFPATSGSVKLFGRDIKDDREMAYVHSISGVCPQHDILWENLSAFEHGMLFAIIKGIHVSSAANEVEQRLSFVGLNGNAHDKVGTFSGGMKRRLSVALATIGDPKLVILDEPTTGMDPVNRRAVWSLILKLRKSRCIIVTTHHMAEADCLGDIVSIMAFGKLLAAADPLNLKNKHGSGYTLSVVLASEDASIQNLKASLEAVVNNVQISEQEGQAVKFLVPQDEVTHVPKLLHIIEEAQASGVVREWGVSDSTLESAFLNLTKRSGFRYVRSEEVELDLEGEQKTDQAATRRERYLPELELTTTPYRDAFVAVVLKNFRLQSRQRCSNICQLLTPILMMMLLWLLQAVIISQVPNQTTNVTLPGIPYPLNSPGLASILDRKNDKSSDYGTHCLEFFWTTHGPNVDETVYKQLIDGLVDASSQRNCSLEDRSSSHNVTLVPFFNSRTSWNDMQAEVLKGLELLQNASVRELRNAFAPVNFRVPDGLIDFINIDRVKQKVHFRFSVNDADVALYHRPNGFSRLASRYASLYDGDISLLIPQGQMALYSLASDAFMQYLSPAPSRSHISSEKAWEAHRLQNPEFNSFIDSTLGLRIAVSMPEQKSESILAIVEIFGSFLYPMALTLQLPVYSFLIVLEKETRVRELSKIMGQKTLVFWAATLFFNMSMYITVVALFWISGAYLQLRFFVQTSPLLLLVFFLLWGLALSAMSMLISAFVSSSRTVVVLGYIVILFGNGIALILSDGIYGEIPQLSVSSRLPTVFLLNPQFAMVRAVFLMNWRCSATLDCYTLTELSFDDELTSCLVFMLFDFFLYLILGLYFDEVLPSQWGVPKHPCWFFRSVKTSAVATLRRTDLDAGEDADVSKERLRVEDIISSNSLDASQLPPVFVQNLSRTFGSGSKLKKAVSDMSLIVDRGEVLGLLGENGAGKTTLISVLIGLLTPSSGQAWIAGRDISCNIDDARLQTGLCPQHDVLIDQLTCEEHLRFFSQMKGVHPRQLKRHIENALQDVGLLEYRHRAAGQLSGGMKRRLQIAISLVGQSSVVLLDEPTTGLDSASRRAIWAIIRRVRRRGNRAIVISTHLMDEAEYLSSRIAIMAHGRLRCLAQQQRLKSLYGNGYKITGNYLEKDRERVDAHVRTICEGCGATCVRVQCFEGQSTWRFQRQSVSSTFAVSIVFDKLHRTAQKAGLTDWALGQVTLDDCFSLITQKYKS